MAGNQWKGAMNYGSHPIRPVAVALVAALLFMLAACGGAAEPAASTTTPADPAGEVPAGVLRAREAVLDYLRAGANECVPPKQAGWTLEEVANPPAGYDVYRFLSGGCAMTITTAAESTAAPVYHVALGDGPTGFCWQAVVDEQGRIVLTGSEAQTDPTLGNPAKSYCEQQGYTFEVVTLKSGQLCGRCEFEDGRSCNAWAFFRGACTPDGAPGADP